MLARLIPDRVTPLAPQEVARAFRGALETVMGRTPSNATLALLVAQSALETGRWKAIHCFNFGNVKAGSTYSGLYCQFRCNEVIKGKIEWFDPPHPQCNFRAFESAESGAIDHIRFLSQSKLYAYAWQVAQTGMPLAFVDALKHAGYFTADETPYAKAVASLWKEYQAMLNNGDADTLPPVREDEAAMHAAALAAVKRDAERFLHVEAASAAYDSEAGIWDWVREEKNAALREES